MNSLRTTGMVLYSVLALTVIAAAIQHVWRVQRDLIQERRLNHEFRSA